uniref:Uncharacterized protein n=1 Tax=Schlesneria paludicola TaxID=360056 RepID=A0A7C4LK80_9PLAN
MPDRLGRRACDGPPRRIVRHGNNSLVSVVPRLARGDSIRPCRLESIKTELDANDLLLADYPEVCHPIQALEGIANRCNGQLYQGERTHIGWTAKHIVLPTLKPQGWRDERLGPFVRDDGR